MSYQLQKWSDLLGTPTTLAGYGITDAATSAALATTNANLATTNANLATTNANLATTDANLASHVADTIGVHGIADTSQLLLVSDLGVTVQEYSDNLRTIALLVTSANKLPYFVAPSVAALTDLTAAGRAILDDADATAQRATLGLVIGTNVQAYDIELAAIAGLTSAADKLPYFTGSGTAALTDLTSAGRALIDDASASAQRTTLGLGTAATQDLTVTGAGTLVTGGFTLTVPATGTAALLAVSNLFTVRQDIRASGSGTASGLYVPWITGDTATTAVFGASTSGNNQIGLISNSDSHIGIFGISQSSVGIVGQSTTGVAVQALVSGAVTGSAVTGIAIMHRTSGTPGANFGIIARLRLQSTTTTDQEAGAWSAIWVDATHATRKARIAFSAYDTAAREGLRIEASGTAPLVGLYGVAAVAQQSLVALSMSVGTGDNTVADVGATFSQTTLNNNFRDCVDKINAIRTILINIGIAV